MTQRRYLAGILLASSVLAGCATNVRELPLTAHATRSVPDEVALYFGDQPHPPLKARIGRHEESARLARSMLTEQQVCDQSLDTALGALRDYARRHGGNAVIGVATRFHGTRSTSQTHFTCGVSGSAGAISVSGEVVWIDAQP